MKLLRRKKNIIYLFGIISAFVSFYLGEIMTFTFTQKIALSIVLILALLILILVSKNTENQLTGENKQSQNAELKRASIILEIIKYTLFLTVIFYLIGFGLTREYAFLFTLIGAGIPWGVLKLTTILLI